MERHERAATDGRSEIKTRVYEEEERDDILTERERRARKRTHTETETHTETHTYSAGFRKTENSACCVI